MCYTVNVLREREKGDSNAALEKNDTTTSTAENPLTIQKRRNDNVYFRFPVAKLIFFLITNDNDNEEQPAMYYTSGFV